MNSLANRRLTFWPKIEFLFPNWIVFSTVGTLYPLRCIRTGVASFACAQSGQLGWWAIGGDAGRKQGYCMDGAVNLFYWQAVNDAWNSGRVGRECACGMCVLCVLHIKMLETRNLWLLSGRWALLTNRSMHIFHIHLQLQMGTGSTVGSPGLEAFKGNRSLTFSHVSQVSLKLT